MEGADRLIPDVTRSNRKPLTYIESPPCCAFPALHHANGQSRRSSHSDRSMKKEVQYSTGIVVMLSGLLFSSVMGDEKILSGVL